MTTVIRLIKIIEGAMDNATDDAKNAMNTVNAIDDAMCIVNDVKSATNDAVLSAEKLQHGRYIM